MPSRETSSCRHSNSVRNHEDAEEDGPPEEVNRVAAGVVVVVTWPVVPGTTEEQARFFFRSLDLDKNGKIDFDEFTRFVDRQTRCGPGEGVGLGAVLPAGVGVRHGEPVTADAPGVGVQVSRRIPSGPSSTRSMPTARKNRAFLFLGLYGRAH